MSKIKNTVTAQDVATLAGVSRSAVSRTFSNNGSIADETKEKVLTAAKQLGYQVNFLAQGLNRQRSNLIGLVVAELTDPFRSTLLEALLREVQHQGYQALVTEIRDDNELDDVIRRFTQFRVSGVVVTSGQPPIEIVEECISSNIPVVGINRHASIPNVDFVCSDNRHGIRLAVTHLINSGRRNIGWLNCEKSTWSGMNRGSEFEDLMVQLQRSGQIKTYNCFTTHSGGYKGGLKAAEKWIKSGPPIDALLCSTAMMACGFLDGIKQSPVKVPDDLQVIGFDNTPITSQQSYQLTTIAQDTKAIARQTLEFLKSRVGNIGIGQRIANVPVKLIIRKSAP
ncbi:LacI family DNA-binding transcriptional regulator [Vibrio salinus]|uniref:LacI family DNA-binding transcriptional regulator n=1 Tax=Vibrio salinus TaxID=2899784 RepID=UPI001E3164F3|nr:LacI family DNA-binding transcriptional regulator [Vibrio salinus]MCE0494867.1 LacI family DNA-binding transcriptional regulator [Vibrio salinus]